jgi:hypothetical protein
MTSGLCAALTGRTHGCTDQPANVKKTLANSEPSTHGTSRRFVVKHQFGRYWRHSGHEWARRLGQKCRD